MVLILNEQSARPYPSTLTDSLSVQIIRLRQFVQPSPALRKTRRRGVCGGEGALHRTVSDG